MKIKNKLIILLSLSSLLILIFVGFIAGISLNNNIFDTINTNYQGQLKQIDSYIIQFFNQIEYDLEELASHPLVLDPEDSEYTSFLGAQESTFRYTYGEKEKAIISLFNQYRLTHPFVHSVYMGRENGSFVRSHPRARPTEYDPRERPWYTIGKENPGLVMRTDPFVSVTTTDISLSLVKSLEDQEGNLLGVIGIAVTLEDLTDYMKNIQFGKRGWISLVDEKGLILVAKNEGYLNTNILELKDSLPTWYEAYMDPEPGYLTVKDDLGKRYSFYRNSKILGWKLLAVIPASETSSMIRSSMVPALLSLALALTTLVTLFFFGLVQLVTKPLSKLSKATQYITQSGNLDHQISIESQDEMGVMATSFNQMMNSIKETKAELTLHKENLEDLVLERTVELNKLNQAVEQSPTSIVITDIEGTIEYVNPQFTKLTGYTAEEILGQNPRILNAENISSDLYEKLWDTILRGEPWDGEMLKKKKDGTLYWEQVSIASVKNESGEILHFVAVKTDITAQKEAELKILENERQLQTLVSTIPGTVYRCVLDKQWTMLYISEEVENLTGYPKSDFIQNKVRTFSSVIHPEDSPLVDRTITEAVKNQVSYALEYRVINSAGEERWVYEKGKAEYDDEGMDRFLDGTIIDITDRKAMEEKFSAIFNYSTDVYMLFDEEINFYDTNPAAKGLFKVENEEEFMHNFPDLHPKTQPDGSNSMEKARDLIAQAFREGFLRFEWMHMASDGELLPCEITLVPIELSGKKYIMGVIHDLRERKRAERALAEAKEAAEAATKAKSDFLANMSHEIRTPMNAVLGMNHLLQKTSLATKQLDYSQKIDRAANNLLGIINDILDFSKIEAGKLDIEAVDFDLEDVLDNVSSIVGIKAQKKGLEFIVSQGKDVPSLLVGDPLRVGQIILNLANNAVKFTEAGEIQVKVQLVESSSEYNTLRFEVQDSGIGLTQEQQGKLFKAFSQADSSTTRKFGGTGLGLSISKKLSELMGGQIGVESEEGKGATFFFTAVLKPSKRKKKKRIIPARLQNLNVLVVDDNESAREVLTEYMGDFSFNVLSAASGKEAVNFVKENGVDLILMDWKMPGMNGNQASQEIKQLELSKQPKIIMVTAYSRSEIHEEAMEVGLDGFLLKPVSPSVLLDTILETFGEEIERDSSGMGEELHRPSGFDEIRGAHLLLVEDNEINQQVARELLEQEGFEIDLAENGKEAVEMVQAKEYHLILMDLQMPIMDGYEATKEIRKTKTSEEQKILAMTADAMSGVREEVLGAGMDDYITKPIEPQELFKALVRWIDPTTVSKKTIKTRAREDSSIDLPSIPELDTEAGLRRVGGNKKLYRDLLVSFYQKNQKFAGEVRHALDTGDREAAERRAHTLKGVAGNIGAKEVFDSVKILDDQLKKDLNDSKQIEEFLDQTQDKLSSLFSQLKTLVDTQITDNELDQKDSLKGEKLLQTIESFTLALEGYDTQVNEILHSLGPNFIEKRLKTQYEELEELINNYDFDAALEIWTKLKEEGF